MKLNNIRRAGLVLGTIFAAVSLAAIPAGALATTKAAKAAAKASATASADQAKIQLIINRGNNEISRRLATLGTLSSKISGAAKLSSDDKASLTSEVTTETSGLTSLKAQLDAETTLPAAKADAQSIINGYRVYALIVPKVNLVKTADDQQVAEAKLADLATKLQTRLNAAQSSGQNVTSLLSGLATMNKDISAAQAISSSIESTVINLQPSDYNSDHSLLSGDRDQLKTAQSDIQAAVAAATNIVSTLKNL